MMYRLCHFWRGGRHDDGVPWWVRNSAATNPIRELGADVQRAALEQLVLPPARSPVENHMLDYLASGMTEQQILHDFPDLEAADIRACLRFAPDRERRLFSMPPE